VALVDDNPFPKVIVVEGSAPASPAAGAQALFIDSADHHWKRKNSGGTVTDLEATGGGSALTIQDEGSSLATAATTINFTGAGVTASGTGATKTVTIPGGGGFTQAYAGYNTVGASWENMATNKVYATKVTLANACLLTGIEAYVQAVNGLTETVQTLGVAVYTDSSGTPGIIVAYSGNPTQSVILDAVSGTGSGASVGRWLGVPVGSWLTAGDYWLAVQGTNIGSTNLQLAFDGSGSDRTYTPGGLWFSDWGFYSPTTTANKYSIRANTIR
jgi:hypothetical protein